MRKMGSRMRVRERMTYGCRRRSRLRKVADLQLGIVRQIRPILTHSGCKMTTFGKKARSQSLNLTN